MPFDLRLRLYTNPTTKGRILPAQGLDVTQTLNAMPILRFGLSERAAGYLPAGFIVALEYRSTSGAWVEPRNARFIAGEDRGDDANESKLVTYSGIGLIPWLLGKNELAWSGSAKDGERAWVNRSPGFILNTFLIEAQNRGWAPFLTWGFTGSAATGGTAWPADTLIDASHPLRAKAFAVLEAMSSSGLCDWWTDGNTLQLGLYGSGVDRTSGPGAVLLGHGATKREGRTNFLEVFTDLTVIPEKSRYWVYLNNPGAPTAFGRLEETLTLDGIESQTVATKLAQPTLQLGRASRREYTVTYDAASGSHTPFEHYNLGDLVRVETRQGIQNLRVVEILTQRDDAGVATVTVAFEYRFRSLQARLAGRTGAASAGRLVGGASGRPIPSAPPLANPLPKAPSGFGVVSNVGTFDADGVPTSTVTLEWDPVAQAIDDSTIDVELYELWLSEFGGERRRVTGTTSPGATLILRPDVEYTAEVRARSVSGLWSAFATAVPFTASRSTAPLAAPTAPILFSSPGAVLVEWDGLLTSGEPPAQFRHAFAAVSDSDPDVITEYTTLRTNYSTNPRFVANAGWSLPAGTGTYIGDGLVAITDAGGSGQLLPYESVTIPAAPGEVWTVSRDFHVPAGSSPVTLRLGLIPYAGGASISPFAYSPTVTINPGETVRLSATGTTPATTTGVRSIPYLMAGGTGRTLKMTAALIERAASSLPPFDGDTADILGSSEPDPREYSWTGTPNASTSIERLPTYGSPFVQAGSTFVSGGTTIGGFLPGAPVWVRLFAVDSNGTVSPGSAIVQAVITPEPAAPTGLSVASSVGEFDANGVPRSRVLLDWDPVTLDTNGDPITVVLYELWIGIGAAEPTLYVASTEPSVDLILDPQTSHTARVRAQGANGLWSAFSTDLTFTTVLDTTPMDAPTPPTVTSKLGSVIVEWDGSLLTGAPPAKYRRMIALVSDTEAGDYGQVGSSFATGGVVMTGFEVGSSVWVRLQAVDSLGILSAPSDAVQITVQGVQGPDLEANSVTTNAIESGAIRTYHLSALVGEQLDISSNVAVNILVGQISEVDGKADATAAELEALGERYSFTTDGLVISDTTSDYSLVLDSDGVAIREFGADVSRWNAGTMTVDTFVGRSVLLGNHQIEKYLGTGGGSVVKFVGGGA